MQNQGQEKQKMQQDPLKRSNAEKVMEELFHLDQTTVFQIAVEPTTWFYTLLNLMLALRHPENNGLASDIQRQFVLSSMSLFANSPAVYNWLQRAWAVNNRQEDSDNGCIH